MVIERFISTKKLEEYIRSEMEERLHANNILPLNSYGWVDEDAPNPDFLGHSEHPLGWNFAFANSMMGEPLAYQLTSWQEAVATSYGDFGGLMAAARLAIGLSLFHGELFAGNIFTSHALFELHWIGAIMNLDMASDRLRDFMIAAVFNKAVKEYEKGEYNNQPRKWYTVPFSEAAHACQGDLSEPSELIRKLVTPAHTIYDYRKVRNEIVHEIATQLGVNENKRLKDAPRSDAGEKPLSDYEFKMIVASHKERVVAKLQSPMQWYNLLVKASSDAFEYMRHKRPPQFR